LGVVWNSTKQDVLPLSTPIQELDGRDITKVPIPNDTNVIMGILAANRNLGPDSYERKPERLLVLIPISLTMKIYISGFKFSQLEIKVVLSLPIESFEVTPSKKEIFWQMNTVMAPTVVGKGTRPQLSQLGRLKTCNQQITRVTLCGLKRYRIMPH
ncbi:hypothetical protein BYT27DRAFT_7083650, partial [Phlegmacium glaucopus]